MYQVRCKRSACINQLNTTGITHVNLNVDKKDKCYNKPSNYHENTWCSIHLEIKMITNISG